MQDNDILWVATTEGLFRLSGDNFTKVNQMPAYLGVCCLVEDGAGGIWFGGLGTGLWHWQSNQTRRWGDRDGLPSENLISLCRTPDGSLWIGTDGSGLVRLKDGHFTVISRQQGLPSATICNVIEDADGRLWMGTYSGICAVSVEELNACAEGRLEQVKCLVLDTSDGMESQECSAGCQPSVCRTADGRLWFATSRGVAVVLPAGIQLNTNPPPVWIEQVKTDNRSITLGQPDQRLDLPLGQRRVQITFNAPCLRAAHRVRFKHRLEPVESGWIDSTDSREVTYTRMLPGDYTFRVIACNEDGVWNMTGAAVALTVPPFFWERAWFVPVCWAGGVGAVAAMVLVTMRRRLKRRLERLEQHRAVDRERSRIAKDLHDDLGGSLTEINMLATALNPGTLPATQADESMSLIAKKSNRVVSALDEIVWAINPKHDSATSLADYLSGTSQEFLAAAGIRLRLDVQRNLAVIPLSPECRHDLFLAVKESLNNVVRHAQATEVRLRFKVADGCLCITVEDDGQGFDVSVMPAGGDGLDNLRARLGSLGGTCRIVSRPGSGTIIEFKVPLK
jgi:signal transduction histidine kinase